MYRYIYCCDDTLLVEVEVPYELALHMLVVAGLQVPLHLDDEPVRQPLLAFPHKKLHFSAYKS